MIDDPTETVMHSGGTPMVLATADGASPIAWVLAVMTGLAMLGLAAALALVPAAGALSGQIAGRATIQIVATDPIARREQVQAVRSALADAPYISTIRTVPEEQLDRMAAQWLGDGVRQSGLPLPALIDADLVGDRAESMQRLARTVSAAAPQARVIAHADWLSPVVAFLTTMGWLSASMAAILALAAGTIAVIAARSTLATQRPTIDILHMFGATDKQVVRLIQRRTAREATVGAVGGGVFAGAIAAVIGWQSAAITSGFATSGDSVARFALLLLVPPLIIAIAVLSARIALLRALKAMP